jgi:hypothetical protein
LLTINLLQPLWFFSVHYLLHFTDVVSFITTFGSMLWILVSLTPAQFGIIPDFFEGFFHLFQTLHWYHLHDSAKEQVFVGLFWLVGGWMISSNCTWACWRLEAAIKVFKFEWLAFLQKIVDLS